MMVSARIAVGIDGPRDRSITARTALMIAPAFNHEFGRAREAPPA